MARRWSAELSGGRRVVPAEALAWATSPDGPAVWKRYSDTMLDVDYSEKPQTANGAALDMGHLQACSSSPAVPSPSPSPSSLFPRSLRSPLMKRNQKVMALWESMGMRQVTDAGD